MEAPYGFKYEVGSDTVKLLRTLYGLKQLPRYWYNTLAATLKKLGFSPITAD